ncbi:MAG: thiamine diphosphokinase [Coriobacteriaceae bacterium]|nr:thiamine diphosphokinase [Coriobacteriaceae bacterium]
MAFKGAIFDCDGTLVDSMRMWNSVIVELARAHGCDGVGQEFFARVESVTLGDGCQIMHDELGIETSASELYEEVCAIVRHHYETDIPLMPGAREFLEELASAGIPMVVATSTPLREARVALEAHGLSRLFQGIVTTEQVGGRDKAFPDVYLEAARRLGTPVGETWVFEDAPFGVRTSKRAGFNVVGLMNDHDGRDERDVRPWCDIYAHGFGELSLALIEDFAGAPMMQGAAAPGARPLRALVVDGSPAPSSPALVARLAAAADYVVAADRGAEACRAAGVVPDVYSGDHDSVSAETDAWARGQAGRSIAFPVEKYATDLSLAIDCARHEAARQARPLRLTVTCASGGRPDHALGVVGLLAGAADASPALVEDAFEMRVVAAGGADEWRLGADARGRTFSAVAVAPGTVVSESGMRWCLEESPLGLLNDLGISNVVEGEDAVVSVSSGAVAAFLLK